MLKYFKLSLIFTIFCLILAFLLGGWGALYITAVLAILEVSLSFDNAVVNAAILGKMSPFWRKLFLTLGVLIAVFGMRLLFPLLIVGVVGSDSLGGASLVQNCNEALKLAIYHKTQFQEILISSHVMIAGFGGTFLFLVSLKYFLDKEKDIHWISIIEKPCSLLGKIEALYVTLALILVFIFSKFISESASFIMASIIGIITYTIVEGVSSVLEEHTPDVSVTKHAFYSGLAMFMYLEVLDASFSFDGVIGSFVLTNDIFVIALGLGIGAMFVRSLTVMLVEKKTLAQYRYVEHGAFWAILSLAIIMFISATGIEIPEYISGSIGVLFLGIAVLSSIIHNKREAIK